MPATPEHASYRFARSSLKVWLIAHLVAVVVLQLACGGGGGPSTDDGATEEHLNALTFCLPWVPLALPTLGSAALALVTALTAFRHARPGHRSTG